jgi:hypothetical protein
VLCAVRTVAVRDVEVALALFKNEVMCLGISVTVRTGALEAVVLLHVSVKCIKTQ